MKCRICGQDKNEGENYQFYYGNRSGPLGTIQSRSGQKLMSLYSVQGSETDFICDSCVAVEAWEKRKNPRVIIGLNLFMLVFLSIGLVPVMGPASGLIGIILFAVLGGVNILLYFRNRNNIRKNPTKWKESPNIDTIGDELLIRSRKPELGKKYNILVSRLAYKNLNK